MEIAIGILIGAAIGATGVGGGTLTAPALILLLGYSPREAVATALIFAGVVKIWATAMYLWKRQIDFRVLGYLLAGGVPGTILGAIVLERMHGVNADRWILSGVGLVIVISALTGLANFRKGDRKAKPHAKWLPLVTFPIGAESGFSSSGSGALGTLMLFRMTTLAPTAIVGTDLAFGMTISLIGGGIHAFSGSCNWQALLMLIPAGIIGSSIGVRIGHGLSTGTLRKAVMFCAAGVGFSLLVKGLEGIL